MVLYNNTPLIGSLRLLARSVRFMSATLSLATLSLRVLHEVSIHTTTKQTQSPLSLKNCFKILS